MTNDMIRTKALTVYSASEQSLANKLRSILKGRPEAAGLSLSVQPVGMQGRVALVVTGEVERDAEWDKRCAALLALEAIEVRKIHAAEDGGLDARKIAALDAAQRKITALNALAMKMHDMKRDILRDADLTLEDLLAFRRGDHGERDEQVDQVMRDGVRAVQYAREELLNMPPNIDWGYLS